MAGDLDPPVEHDATLGRGSAFVSNFPEALAGAVRTRDQGRSRRRVLTLWGATSGLLAATVLAGRYAFAGPEGLSLPLAFAGGAVLASVVDTLAPEAVGGGGPFVALGSAAGFFTAFLLSA